MPAPSSKTTIVNVGYRSTNFWVVSAGRTRLLVDLGWPGMMGALKAAMERMSVPLSEIRYGLATHYHMDHAGLGEELKRAGMTLIVVDLQEPFIDPMQSVMKPSDHYTPITRTGNAVISCDDSRAYLAKIGIDGEIVHTPGHSDDSVSLLLDDGSVFTGDLTHPAFVQDETVEVVHGSWRALQERGAKTVYAGHGPVRPMPTVP